MDIHNVYQKLKLTFTNSHSKKDELYVNVDVIKNQSPTFSLLVL